MTSSCDRPVITGECGDAQMAPGFLSWSHRRVSISDLFEPVVTTNMWLSHSQTLGGSVSRLCPTQTALRVAVAPTELKISREEAVVAQTHCQRVHLFNLVSTWQPQWSNLVD